MTPRCSIVIRAYNEEKHIDRLLAGILKQTIKDVQIILVDSGSTDSTLSIASHYPIEIIHIAPKDFTFGRSLNMGISASRAEFVVLASAHVYPVYPDWLENLLFPFENPRVALTYGKQRGNENSKFSEKQVFNHWFPEDSQICQNHPFCNNANAAIRFSLWEKHRYNENLPALEDLAWANWVIEQGYLISYISEAEVIHIHNETWAKVYNRYRREGMAFKQIYPYESFQLKDTISLFLGNLINDLQAARKYGVPRSAWTDMLSFRFMQFWGTYQGYRQSGPLTKQLRQAFYYPRDPIQANAEKSKRPVSPIYYRS